MPSEHEGITRCGRAPCVVRARGMAPHGPLGLLGGLQEACPLARAAFSAFSVLTALATLEIYYIHSYKLSQAQHPSLGKVTLPRPWAQVHTTSTSIYGFSPLLLLLFRLFE
ncbi:hypothetical protein TIFTF001_038852 [Ficus carica]|uniref:Uncharacterized protein n=1 Tax=Ficus carica TaxID=3494 RepID=A0AA88E807_FICCA|nr:hypothetical protein TIFTF001_038852 [Ficus carica]